MCHNSINTGQIMAAYRQPLSSSSCITPRGSIFVFVGISRRVDGWAVSACEFSCVSIVRWRQHILVHRWCSCETVKWHRRQLSFFLSSAADQRCVDVQNWIFPSRRSVSTASDLGRLFPRLLDQYCIAEGFSLTNLCTVDSNKNIYLKREFKVKQYMQSYPKSYF